MFGAAKLTKNVDLDKYVYSGYGTGLDAGSYFSIKGEFDKDVNFSVDNSSPVLVDNSKRIYLSSWLRSNTKIR